MTLPTIWDFDVEEPHKGLAGIASWIALPTSTKRLRGGVPPLHSEAIRIDRPRIFELVEFTHAAFERIL